MTETCDHEWVEAFLTDGRPISQCSKCPRWRLEIRPISRDPENTRRSMEETSRYLGEHRDV
jgi:hypothetical protein